MKRVTINTNNVGLVYKKGELKRVLTAGTYWLGFGETVETYDLSKDYQFSATELDLLLPNKAFMSIANLVEVSDNELVLIYRNHNFKGVLTAGRHIIWKGLSSYEFVRADISQIEIDPTIDKNLFEKPALVNFLRAYRVEMYEEALLIVDGKLETILTGGTYVYWKNNITVQVLRADRRQLNLEVIGQEILTKDKAQLRMNFNLQYQVSDLKVALLGNAAFEKQLYILIQLALRATVGLLSFDELMESKEIIGKKVIEVTAERAKDLGVVLIDGGVKDIVLPGEIKDIMNQVLIAEKRAQANIITRREETASTRSLLNTAKLMEDNNMLYKLKEMEYVEKIAEKIHTISLGGSGQIVDQLKQIFVK